MFFYIIIIAILLVLNTVKLNKIQSKYFLIFSMLALWMIASFRSYDIGSDTENYYRLFNTIRAIGYYKDMTWRFETGYLFINYLVSLLTNNFTVFLIIVNTYMYFIYYKFIEKYSSDYLLSVLLFFTFGAWSDSITILRLEIATTTFLLGFMLTDKIRKRSIIIKFITIWLSFMVHRISLIFSFGFLLPRNFNKKIYKYSLFATLIILIFLPSILNLAGKIIPYFSETYLGPSSTYIIDDIKLASFLKLTMSLLVFVLGYFYYKVGSDNSINVAIQLNMVWMSSLILLLSLRFNILDRCSNFYWTFSIVLIPNIIQYNVQLLRNKKIIKILIIVLGISYFLITNILRPEWSSIYPYKFIFY